MNKVLFRGFPESSTRVWPEERDLLMRHDIYFENRAADSAELVELAHTLRYQVYVNERKFENPDHHVDGLEIDEFDSHSLLGLVFHRPTGEAIGTARLIMPIAGQRGSLPADALLRENGIDIADYVPIEKTVEISRFAISKSFRRRITDDPDSAVAPPLSREERIRRGNLVCLSLMQFLLRRGVDSGGTHIAAVMEEKLLRMLASMGIHFTPLGPLVNHHGLRQPCYCDAATMLDRCRYEQPDYWEVITNAGELIERMNRRMVKPKALAC